MRAGTKAKGGDMAARLNRIAIAADRRADSLPTNDPVRAFQIAQSDLALSRLAQLHGRRLG